MKKESLEQAKQVYLIEKECIEKMADFFDEEAYSKAVELLKQGIGNRIIGIRDNKIFDVDIIEGLSLKNEFRTDLYNLAATVAK